MIVIIIIFGIILGTTISGVALALKCPNCKKWFELEKKWPYIKFALVWQDVHQRDICRYCAWFVEAKEFTPPKAKWLEWMAAFSPLKQFNVVKDIKDRRKKK